MTLLNTLLTFQHHLRHSCTNSQNKNGYDSDAGLDPNDAVINEGPLERDEEDIQEVRFDSEAAAGAVAAVNLLIYLNRNSQN